MKKRRLDVSVQAWIIRRAAIFRGGRGSRRRQASELGFSLIELIIVVAILPLILGAIAVALVAVFSLQGSVSNRLSASGDAQIVSSFYVKDVQSAAQFTTNASPSLECGTGTQLLGLEWSWDPTNARYLNVVSYVDVPSGASNHSLVRQYCSSGASATPTSSSTISYDINARALAGVGQPPPTIAPASVDTAAAAGWTSTAGATEVKFPITEPHSNNYLYTLAAVPRSSGNTVQPSSIARPSSTCGFAKPDPGVFTYAAQLCFVDLSAWNTQTSAIGSSCVAPTIGIIEGIANTPFTLSFCMQIVATGAGSFNTGCQSFVNQTSFLTFTGCNDVAAVPDPTWTNSFLGNNGFYTNIPGNPMLYTAVSGSSATVYITNLVVLSANGTPATGWSLETGDAESTDAAESITWTAGWNNALTVPLANQVWTLTPNNPTPSTPAYVNQYGDACDTSLDDTVSPPVEATAPNLTGLGTNSVTCATSASATVPRTGTVMLQAPQPNSLTITLNGGGLQAAFIGFLL